MDIRIKQIVSIYFDDICYSDQVAKARQRIESALNSKLVELTANSSGNDGFEQLISEYGRLTDMAVLAGYTADDVSAWRFAGEAIDLKTVKKNLGRQRWLICLVSLLAVSAFTEFLWLIYDICNGYVQALGVLALFALFSYFCFLLDRRVKRRKKELDACKYDTAAFEYLCRISDKYAKRRLNTIALFVATVVILELSELAFYFFGNSKSAEVIENILLNIIIVQVPLFLLIKNSLYQKRLGRIVNTVDKRTYKKHLLGITIFSLAYWLIVIILAFGFAAKVRYPANLIFLAGVIFALLILFYNMVIRRSYTYKNIVINRLRIAVFITVFILFSAYQHFQRDTWYTQPYINSVPVVKYENSQIEYNDESGVYTITSDKDVFKILHLTDIHLGGSLYSFGKDIKALKACYAEIEHTKPDLVIVTGDLCFPLGVMSMSLNNSAPVNQFAAFMRNTGVPWAFTYGNHDTESLATLSQGELDAVFKKLSYKTSGNLLYPYIQPDISGRGNQLIEVRKSDGSLITALFLIDSNAYTGEGINVYDYIHDDQVEWYAQEVERLKDEAGGWINSLVFFHIPLQQYRTAYELYEAGSNEVRYFYGENNEKMINKVCCSDYPSGLFNKMVELGSTTGTFCGHDHYNNMSLEYKGIRLTYGMSIDYLAMPGIEDDTAQRGAELITVNNDGTWNSEQIPLDSISVK